MEVELYMLWSLSEPQKRRFLAIVVCGKALSSVINIIRTLENHQTKLSIVQLVSAKTEKGKDTIRIRNFWLLIFHCTGTNAFVFSRL